MYLIPNSATPPAVNTYKEHKQNKQYQMLSSQCIEKLEIIGSGSFGRVFKW